MQTWSKAVHSYATVLHLLLLPPPLRWASFVGVCVEGVEGLGLFPLNWRGVSAGFCGCFDKPAASAFTSARAATSPRHLTILRIAVSSSLNTSVLFHAAHRLTNGDNDVDGETTTAKLCFSYSFVHQGCRAAVAAGRCFAEWHHEHAPGSFARTTLVANAERNMHTDALTRICPRSTGCQPRMNDNDNNIAARNPRISPCNHVGLA